MSFTIESIKYFNQLRNGDDYSLNTSDYTVSLKDNVGDKVKKVTTFYYNNNHIFDTVTAETLKVSAGFIGGDFDIELLYTDWFDEGYRIGDTIDVYDNGTAGIVASGVIQNITGTKITITGTGTSATYTDGLVRDITPLYYFRFDWKLSDNITGLELFDSLRRYENTSEVGTGGTRSTSLVSFVARSPQGWDSGSFKMRYVDNPDLYTQRFEIEHTFVITPFHIQGNVYEPLTLPDTFRNGTLKYEWEIFNREDTFVNYRSITKYISGGTESVGWFNENFDGGVSDYSLTSIAYYDVDDAVALTGINVLNTTRVTAVIGGTFLTAKPVLITHSKAPTEAEYQAENSFSDNWIYENLLNSIDSGATAGTIISNYTITLDSGTQITVVFDLDYTTEDVLEADKSLLWLSLETDTLNANQTNRVNLFLGNPSYVKSDDEVGLFQVSSFEIYDHLTNVGVGGNSDYTGFVEDGILVDFQFTLNPQSSRKPRLDKLWLNLVAYNSVEDVYFNIHQNQLLGSSGFALDGSFRYELFEVDTSMGYNLESGSQFNIKKIEYLGNDGTDATYRVQLGVKINWQETVEVMTSSNSTNRFEDSYVREYNDFTERDGLSTLINEDFYNPTKPLNNLNENTSNYFSGDWTPRLLVLAECVNDGSNRTNFFEFSPAIPIYNYDTNSVYTGSIVTQDSTGADLSGGILEAENTTIIATFDDGETKTDLTLIEGIIRIEIEGQQGFDIHELSTIRATYSSNLLVGATTTYADKSLVSDNYTITAEIDYSKLTGKNYKISARLLERVQVASNKVMRFDGVDEYVDLGNDSTLSFERTDSFSYSGWFKRSSNSGEIISKFDGTKGIEIDFNDTALTVKLSNSGANLINKDFTYSSVGTGTWFHIAVTYDGTSLASGLKAYKNGSEIVAVTVTTDALSSTIVNTTSMYLARIGAVYFAGDMDWISVHNVELTPTEIAELYHNGCPKNIAEFTGINNVVSWWKMGDDTLDTISLINDQVEESHTSFDGVNEYISIPHNSILSFTDTESFTLSGWFYLDVNNIVQSMFYKRDGAGYLLRMVNDKVNFTLSDASLNRIQGNSTISLSALKWHHIAFTYDGTALISGCKLYINGVSDTVVTLNDALAVSILESSDLIIGSYNPPASYFSGKMDKITIYNDKLTSGEVTTIYNYGRNAGLIGIGNEVAQWEMDTLNPYDVSDFGYNNGTSVNMLSANIIDGRNQGTPTNMESSDIVEDSVCNPYNRFSVSFDGATEYVDCGNDASLDLDYNQSMSYGCWVNTLSLASVQIVMSRQSNLTPFKGYQIQLQTTGKIRVSLNNDASTNKISVESTTALSINNWYHILVTKSTSNLASGVKIYINGISDTLTVLADTLTASYSQTLDFNIGAKVNNSISNQFFSGYIDESSVWDKELSGTEVTEVYNLGNPYNLSLHSATANLVSWWRLGEGDTYPTLLDSKGSNDGTMTNMDATNINTNTP